jgi:hypothetical protein
MAKLSGLVTNTTDSNDKIYGPGTASGRKFASLFVPSIGDSLSDSNFVCLSKYAS